MKKAEDCKLPITLTLNPKVRCPVCECEVEPEELDTEYPNGIRCIDCVLDDMARLDAD